MNVVIIGGGAAGFFSALSCKQHFPESEVTIVEKSVKLLSKVKVSGGGRCNVTNACSGISELSKNYPRGGTELKKAFAVFKTTDTIEWFRTRGVELKTEADQRVFPVTDNSQTIIDCFMREADKSNINIRLNCKIDSIQKDHEQFILKISGEEEIVADRIIVASGGSPNLEGFNWLQDLGHEIVPPVPSLFTFNIADKSLHELSGISVENSLVKIQGTKIQQYGPILITHWGMSGPAVLKLSSLAARVLNELNYDFKIQVRWTGEMSENLLREWFDKEFVNLKQKQLSNTKLFDLPSRLWMYLLKKCGLNPEWKWNSISKDHFNKLINALTNDIYHVKGKTTFKEEFVTSGGVSLKNISFETMESKVCKGMYFAGEVLDIDGVTGGFNFQSAWTCGFIAGKSVLK